MNYNKSAALFQKGSKHLVGAVNSPVRAFKSVGGNPLFIESGKGAYITDADGNKYYDLVGSYGPNILGHAYPEVLEEVTKACEKGFSFGASTEAEIELAEMVCDAFPGMDKVRFVNSGTEAVFSAIRLARAYTGKNKIIKFAGCYHGHTDSLLVAAGSGVVTFGLPGSKGVPLEAVRDTLVGIYNDVESAEMLIKQFKGEIAAIIIEPVSGNMGVIPPKNDFLNRLKQIANKHNILLIIDEVMTGFRKLFGGAQQYFNVAADITCLGKIVCGGFPVGAYGARNEIMQMVAPLGEVYQAGTLSGNPVAMAAGIATLKVLKRMNPYEKFEDYTTQLTETMFAAAEKYNIPLQVNSFGSMFNPFFTKKEINNFDDVQSCDTRLFSVFFHALLEHGIYVPPSQFESWFLPAIIEAPHLDILKEGITNAFQSIAQ